MKDNKMIKLRSIKLVDSNMVEVNGIDTVEEHFHQMNHRLEMEGMDIVDEHFHPINHRSKVEGMNTVDTSMGG
jgi:hypothetical protein